VHHGAGVEGAGAVPRTLRSGHGLRR
jgi:hypothetical protein